MPTLLHDDEHDVPGFPLLTYTHEQGTKRIVDRQSGIDIDILLRWQAAGTLPEDIKPESLEQAVRYRSELDAKEFLLAFITCTSRGERFGAPALQKFRLLPLADRELLRKLFEERPIDFERLNSEPGPEPEPCKCNALVLHDRGRGHYGYARCTKCFHEWPERYDLPPHDEWRADPTYADALDKIR